jgi:hypothetical protein
MTRATLAALFSLTPDLLARLGRGLVVALARIIHGPGQEGVPERVK